MPARNRCRHRGHARLPANRARGRAAAADQRDLLLRHAERIKAEIAAQHARLEYLTAKAALWDARDRADTAAEEAAVDRVMKVINQLEAPQ